MLTLAIDYDGTFTVDPAFWRHVIDYAFSCGHKVICVTARRGETLAKRRDVKSALPRGVVVLFAYDCPKRKFADDNGFEVDIWIDDKPESITQEL